MVELETKEITCPLCGTVFQTELDGTEFSIEDSEESYYIVRCPECEEDIFVGKESNIAILFDFVDEDKITIKSHDK